MTDTTILSSELYLRAIEHKKQMEHLEFVLNESIPILFFGDIESYMSSKIRILTLALNPSDAEFPKEYPRFNIKRAMSGPVGLEEQLSRYFNVNPYKRWFSSFEPVLNGSEASYGGKMNSAKYSFTALHIDICSPLATDPTWSYLEPNQRDLLTKFGRFLFGELINALSPDLVLGSLGWSHLLDWDNNLGKRELWKEIIKYQISSTGKQLRVPLAVCCREFHNEANKKILFVNGSAAEKPFGRFTTKRKMEVGKRLLELVG